MPKPRDKLRRYMIGGARIGSAGSYTDIGPGGNITQAGTATTTLGTGAFSAPGTNTLSGTTTISGAATISNTLALSGAATITAAPVLSGSGRPTRRFWMPISEWYISGASITDGVLNSKFRSLYFHPDASTSDISMTGNWEIPADLDTTYGITPRVWWSVGAKGASAVADWDLTVENLPTGSSAGAAASTADITAGASSGAYAANRVVRSALSTIGAGAFATSDILSLILKLEGSDAKTTAGCPYFLGLELEYRGATL